MKIVLWVLMGVGAFVLLGAVVLPLLGWLVHTLAWVAAGALVIGGGIALARRLGGAGERDEISSSSHR